MGLEKDLEILKRKVELREEQLAELQEKHGDLIKHVKKIDKRTKIRPVMLKEVSPSLVRTISTELIKASVILIATIYINRLLTKQKISSEVEKTIRKKEGN